MADPSSPEHVLACSEPTDGADSVAISEAGKR